MYAADSRHHNSALQRKLEHLYTLKGGPSIDLTIRPAYYELLRRLGQPHQNLPPVIHVAGTNGKGSTIAAMRAILTAAGYRAHVYTSPHLLRFNERIVLANQEIDDVQLETLLDEVIEKTGNLPLTFFEVTTALAFTAFARHPADIVLLETGLGGRLDCTNVVARPAATIITTIGYDHQEFLGTTLPQIATEKAGILKPGVPCIIGAQSHAEVWPVFTDRAAALNTPLYRFDQEWSATAAGSTMTFTMAGKTRSLPLPSLTGAHQIANAGAAIAALRLQHAFRIHDSAIAAGLRSIHWPGRLQRLPDPAPAWELWCDGAHNENGATALAKQLATWHAQDGKPLHLILGMLRTKNVAGFLAPLRPHTTTITAVPIAGEPQSHTADTLSLTVTPPLAMAADLETALTTLMTHHPSGRILITGSLYLVAQALQTFSRPFRLDFAAFAPENKA